MSLQQLLSMSVECVNIGGAMGLLQLSVLIAHRLTPAPLFVIPTKTNGTSGTLQHCENLHRHTAYLKEIRLVTSVFTSIVIAIAFDLS